MIDKIEKICHGLCGLAILVVAVLYFWLPTPDTYPKEFIPTTVVSSIIPEKLKSPKDPEQKPVTPLTITQEKNKVLAKLRKASSRAMSVKSIEMKYMGIHRQSFDYIKNEANWLPELKMAAKKVITSKKDGTSQSLQLTRIKEGSLLRSVVGLEAGDTIELINGERWEFSDDKTLNYRAQAMEMIEKIEAGGSISLTITRNKKPQHLTFSLLE